MPVERSAGIILFKEVPEGRRYLLLRSSREEKTGSTMSTGGREFWDFSKGVLEEKESGIDAALREVKEETNIENIEIIPGFKETIRYFTRHEGKPIPKFVAMFLGKIENQKIELSWEHDKFEWLPFEEAYDRLSVKPMKEALQKAEEFLNKK